MGGVDSFPVISQIKSAVQAIAGDEAGAQQTQINFIRRCPIFSQTTSAVYALQGDTQEARNVQCEFGQAMSNMADGIPIVGHLKGGIHYAVGDTEGGDNAMKASSRSVGVIAGGVGGFLIGGPPGAVVGGIGGGATMDVLTTGVDSAVHDEYRPAGLWKAIDGAVNDGQEGRNVAGAVFDATVVPVFDGLGGYFSGKLIGQPITKALNASQSGTVATLSAEANVAGAAAVAAEDGTGSAVVGVRGFTGAVAEAGGGTVDVVVAASSDAAAGGGVSGVVVNVAQDSASNVVVNTVNTGSGAVANVASEVSAPVVRVAANTVRASHSFGQQGAAILTADTASGGAAGIVARLGTEGTNAVVGTVVKGGINGGAGAVVNVATDGAAGAIVNVGARGGVQVVVNLATEAGQNVLINSVSEIGSGVGPALTSGEMTGLLQSSGAASGSGALMSYTSATGGSTGSGAAIANAVRTGGTGLSISVASAPSQLPLEHFVNTDVGSSWGLTSANGASSSSLILSRQGFTLQTTQVIDTINQKLATVLSVPQLNGFNLYKLLCNLQEHQYIRLDGVLKNACKNYDSRLINASVKFNAVMCCNAFGDFVNYTEFSCEYASRLAGTLQAQYWALDIAGRDQYHVLNGLKKQGSPGVKFFKEIAIQDLCESLESSGSNSRIAVDFQSILQKVKIEHSKCQVQFFDSNTATYHYYKHSVVGGEVISAEVYFDYSQKAVQHAFANKAQWYDPSKIKFDIKQEILGRNTLLAIKLDTKTCKWFLCTFIIKDKIPSALPG